jgi:hypothetical protein
VVLGSLNSASPLLKLPNAWHELSVCLSNVTSLNISASSLLIAYMLRFAIAKDSQILDPGLSRHS